MTSDAVVFSEFPDGFVIALDGQVDVRWRFPWASAGLGLAAGFAAWMIDPLAAMPLVAVGLAVFRPRHGRPCLEVMVRLGKLTLHNGGVLLLHQIQAVDPTPTGVVFRLDGGARRLLHFTGGPEARERVVSRLRRAVAAQGDDHEVPEQLGALLQGGSPA